MFEKAPPLSDANDPRFEGCDPLAADAVVGSEETAPALVGEALRALDWSELTARLGAARDLRVVLQREAQRSKASRSGGFARAAEHYFRARDNSEQGVNPVALEQRKGSPCISRISDEANPQEARDRSPAHSKDAQAGEARDN